MIAWRDIRVKYKQSVMGFMWAIFMPMLIVCAGGLVRYAISILSEKPMALSQLVTVSVKAVPWAFFVGSLRFGTNSLLQNKTLVTKIYFPKEIFPIAAVLSSFFDFGVAGIFLVVILTILGTGGSIYLLWVPVLLLILVALAMGLSIMLSALNLFFRDVRYLVEVILTFAIFFTPVLYEVEMFGRAGRVLLLNPVAPILEAVNSCVVLHRAPELWWVLYSVAISLLFLALAYSKFKDLEPRFAERI
jgi:lipopolysaccharide transport system permease protein